MEEQSSEGSIWKVKRKEGKGWTTHLRDSVITENS